MNLSRPNPIEIWSTGTLLTGITAEALGRQRESILRNHLTAGTSYSTGAVEVWGRGTDRVIEECKRWGVEPPSFDVVTGSLWVRFPAEIGPGAQLGDQVGTKLGPSRDQVQVLEAARDAQ
jgi:ATP-dependent DNA helicase RecG